MFDFITTKYIWLTFIMFFSTKYFVVSSGIYVSGKSSFKNMITLITIRQAYSKGMINKH